MRQEFEDSAACRMSELIQTVDTKTKQIGGLQSELDEVVALREVSKKEVAAANIQIVRLPNENLAKPQSLLSCKKLTKLS